MEKRFSQSCDNNKQPIIEQLKTHFCSSQRVLEIGSGTGQHGLFFSAQLPHLEWYTSDLVDNHASIMAWMMEEPRDNLHAPVAFRIGKDRWPVSNIDAVFTANSTHIMQPDEAKLMMQMVAENLSIGGIFCQYGPFKVEGQYTSDSNRDFDAHLQTQGYGGLRDLAELTSWAGCMTLTESIPMAANNFLLVWRK